MSKKVKANVPGSTKRFGTDRMLGEDLSFAATEAYKLLRTNLFFCLPNDGEPKCRVVGVTSSVQGEGKSTTSINLSYMLAQDGKRVCLVEGDMRAPTLSNRLKLRRTKGLSHILAGLQTDTSVVTKTELHPNLNVIPAGEMPPNPAELLGSERMVRMTELLSDMFDFVIIDLPPITVVADALAVSGVLDGMIVVVENGSTTKRELNDAMQRLDMIHDKILGFVVTHADGAGGRYGYKKKYGYGYGYGYGHKKKSEKKDEQDS